LCGVALVFAAAGFGSLHAAIVTWDAPQSISSASDVNTNGSYVGSWAPYDTLAKNYPVNGVVFYGDDLGITYNGFASGSQTFGPQTTPDAHYNALLPCGIYADGTNSSFTVNGDGTRPLVVRRQYLIQFWVTDTRGLSAGRTESVSGSGALNFQTGSGMGQYVVGRFTADAPTQTFTLSASVSAQVNLLQIRDLSTNVPPSLSGVASPNVLSVGQTIFVQVTVNSGSSPSITNVILDASQLGGVAPIPLISAGGNVYTNSLTVGAGTVYGFQTLLATATDGAGFQGQGAIGVFLPAPAPYKATTPALEAWRSNRFGMFIHWGPATLTGQEISWSRANSNPLCPNDGPTSVEVYDHLYKGFNPTDFNATNWSPSPARPA